MKVVCVDNSKRGRLSVGEGSYLPLTIGKIYEIEFQDPKIVDLYFYVKDDLEKVKLYDSWRFVSLEEWRERQLKEIGI